jgi:uncharacterized protein (TIGR02391 family)
MRELIQAIPDADVLIALQPEELAAKMLFCIPAFMRRKHSNMIHKEGPLSDLNEARKEPNFPYAEDKIPEVKRALREAWAWLEAQGLVIPAEGNNGQNGYRELSRRATNFANEQEFARYDAARRLPREALHPKIAQPVWQAYMRGEFDVAVFLATKAVEVAVREATGLPDDLVGVKLMRTAFHPQNGALTDPQAEAGERTAMEHLFAGAMGVFKNPQSHRDVDLNDPQAALEIVLFANHLLRIVEERRPNAPAGYL